MKAKSIKYAFLVLTFASMAGAYLAILNIFMIAGNPSYAGCDDWCFLKVLSLFWAFTVLGVVSLTLFVKTLKREQKQLLR
jgi:hypothetical protein